VFALACSKLSLQDMRDNRPNLSYALFRSAMLWPHFLFRFPETILVVFVVVFLKTIFTQERPTLEQSFAKKRMTSRFKISKIN
jgi:hypothetical protein